MVKDKIKHEEDSDSDHSPFKNKKQKLNAASKFFEDEAEEGDSDDQGEKLVNAKDQYYTENELKRKNPDMRTKLSEMEQKALRHEQKRA